jgi:hypothetical protein
MKDDMIFGPLLDVFFVIKFQNHGSEHDQGLLWVANAPNLHGLDCNKIIEIFVDKYITCDSDYLTTNLHEAQRHHHKKTCRKKNQVYSSFQSSMALMEKTTNS